MQYIRVLLVLMYFFTAQLTVHAFGMHPMGDIEAMHDHNHSQHDHESEDNENHDMTMCLSQSEGISVGITFETSRTGNIKYNLSYTQSEQSMQTRYYRLLYAIDDPGRGKDGLFSQFLNNNLYGHGIIMHC